MGKITIRPMRADDLDEVITFDGLAFGDPWPDNLRQHVGPTFDFDRFRVVHDGRHLVGVAGSYQLELTVPGQAQVPTGGVTWVAVAPTHRRQGLLTRLMGELHDDIDARNETIAALTASEGGIYERFGYGIASYLRVIEIDRRRAQIKPEHRPRPGDVMMTTIDDPRLPELYDRYRRQQIGEVNRTPEWDTLDRAFLGNGYTAAIHREGYAVWKVKAEWNEGHPAHELSLSEVIALTPEAHAALWHTILSVDLVGPIRGRRAVAIDDTLPYLLTDQRALRTTNVNDMLWLNIRDVPAALSARTYATDDTLVLEVHADGAAARYRVDGSPDGASVHKVRSRPDIVLDRTSLGAIYLGGVRPSVLARAGRLTPRDAAALRRIDAFVAAERLPHCSTGF